MTAGGVGPVPLVDVPAACLERQGRIFSVIRIDLYRDLRDRCVQGLA